MKGRWNSSEKVLKPQYYWRVGSRFVLHTSGKILYFEMPSTRSVHIFNLWLGIHRGYAEGQQVVCEFLTKGGYHSLSLRYPRVSCVLKSWSSSPHSPALPWGCQVYKDWAKSWRILPLKHLNGFRAKTCAYWHLGFSLSLAVLCWMTLKSYNLCTEFSSGF